MDLPSSFPESTEAELLAAREQATGQPRAELAGVALGLLYKWDKGSVAWDWPIAGHADVKNPERT